ncbi:MAG: NAD(+) diphosphatase [Lachnospiraceae bacterium]
MIQEIGNYKFDNQYKNTKPREEDYALYFSGTGRKNDKVLVKNGDEIDLPKIKEIRKYYGEIVPEEIYLFSIDEMRFFLIFEKKEKEEYQETGKSDIIGQYGISERILYAKENKNGKSDNYFHMEPVRIFRKNNPGFLCFTGMTAYHLFSWYRDAAFCGRCGARTLHDDKIRMKKCPVCNNMLFPRISPAVIIGLRKGDSLLLSKYAGREYKGRALLAGFCEIGETPEETVSREVMEEVGLKVKNITYFGSQPWGFDSNLLLGYFADLDGEEQITLDEEELECAGFVKRSDITYESNQMSLTATMIEAFRQGKW